MRFLLNVYPPYLGAGVRVTHVDSKWRELRVSMKLRWFNRNAVGTHFGGSLYSMVDPHLMLLLMQVLGDDYVVWDKSATIDFVRPGRGRVHAVLRMPEEEVAEIRRRTAGGRPHEPEFTVYVRGADDEVIARVRKTLYVRRKPSARAAEGG